MTNIKSTQLQPLVSIIVITYNSSNYVLETLESIKAQTYQNIELIVSDDCSTDDTIEICQKWVQENKERFTRIELITVPVNTGISANCNRGVKAAQGEWLKSIAGDDMLLPNCIENNISIVSKNPKINILQTNLNYYENTFSPDKFISTSNIQNDPFFNAGVSASLQAKLTLNRTRVMAPSIFIKAEVIRNVGGYDEDIPLMEDAPFWVKVTKSGYRIDYSEAITVNYRRHINSVTKNGRVVICSAYANSMLAYSKKYKRNNVSHTHYYAYNLAAYLIIIFNKIGLSKINFLHIKLFNYIIYLLTNIAINSECRR